MNYLLLFFFVFDFGQSVLLSQTDSTKKKFKPYALIDAAPVAVNKDDFKPQINLTIQSIDAITNLPVDAKIDYYTFGDSVVTSKNGKAVSFPSIGNEKIIIVSNASGYIWQSQIFNTPVADTSTILKFKKIRKGDEITLYNVDFSFQNNKFESSFYAELLGLKEFLKLNSNVVIYIYNCPKGKEDIFLRLLKNSEKKRFHFKSSATQKRINSETITIKILSI